LDLNIVDAAGVALVRTLNTGSLFFDWLIRFLLSVPLVKLGVPVAVALYAWMGQRADEADAARLRRVVWSLLGVVLAIGMGRAIQDGLPPRDRPREGMPDFPFPFLDDMPDLSEWSSIPSDHAVLAAALATAAWAYSRRLGLASAIWGVFVVAFPRLYFGYHYLTDLLAGGAFGTIVTLLVIRLGRSRALERWYGLAERRVPGLVALGLFLVGYEFVTLFETTRRLLGAARDVLHGLHLIG
jgi:undecaprenyl-diphosphatase